ncbi:hypothetical protein HMN09_00861600 [Mycena chlorophos]|uniref:Uncharacterized protein n=1 Tax=Mycena chlorophos TaxID=658473 RepID=A0A8H6SVA9_MYCCL|nr:hypothetical protein HMN09_00861600 [Mycena chlorophos]
MPISVCLLLWIDVGVLFGAWLVSRLNLTLITALYAVSRSPVPRCCMASGTSDGGVLVVLEGLRGKAPGLCRKAFAGPSTEGWLLSTVLKAERKALPPKRKGGGGRRRTGESSSGRVPVKYIAPENPVPASAAPLPEHIHLRAQQPMPPVFPTYPSPTNVIPRLSGLPTSDFTFASSVAPASPSTITPPSAFTTHSMALGPVPSAVSATVPYLQQSPVSPYAQTMSAASMAPPFPDLDMSTATGVIYPRLNDFDFDWSYLDAFVAGDIALPTQEPAEATLASGARQAPDPAPQPPLYVAPSDTILPLPAPSPSPPPASSGVGEKRKDRDEDKDGGEDGTGGQVKRLCVRRSERNTGMKKKAWPPRDYEREYA